MIEPPEPELVTYADGSVLVMVGKHCGIVTSHHLVPTKANQLREAWRQAHSLNRALLRKEQTQPLG